MEDSDQRSGGEGMTGLEPCASPSHVAFAASGSENLGTCEALLESVPDQLIAFDADGCCLFANAAALSAFGVERALLVGHTAREAGLPDTLVGALEAYAAAPAPRVVTTIAMTETAERLKVQYTLAPLIGASGESTGLVLSGHDLSEQRRAEGLLSAEKAVGEAIIAAAPGLFYTVDREGRLLRWNATLEERLARSADQLPGLNLLELLEDDERARAEQAMREVFENGSAEVQLRVVGRHGPRVYMMRARCVEIAGAPYLVGFGADVTDRVAAEDGLRRAHAELERRVVERTAELESANVRLKRTERALMTLSWSNQTLVRAVDRDQLLQDVCDAAVDVGGYRMAWVGIVEHDEAKTVRPIAFSGADQSFFETVGVSWGEGPTGRGTVGRVVRDMRPATVTDIATDESYEPWRADALAQGYRSVVSLPLIDAEGEVYGIFSLFAGESGAFDDREVALLEELAMDLSFGIESLRVRAQRGEAEQELHESYERLERMMRDVVASMGRIVEARDPYTQGHERRVAVLAKQIAAEMGLDADAIAAVEMAALLHDIGKLCVPAEILTKPGLLSVSEFSLIKDHSRRGYEILKDISFPWPIADIVLQHHERIDGSGYPSGLHGDEILVPARILAVADVVEAMASHRPYRPCIGIEQAMSEIRERPGAYDEAVVAACERLYAQGRIAL